jgi:hypothetical protein
LRLQRPLSTAQTALFKTYFRAAPILFLKRTLKSRTAIW